MNVSASHLAVTHSGSLILVELMKSSSVRFQLARSPFTRPEMMTKPSTTRLIPVKILFTRADSLTPNASRPVWVSALKSSQDTIHLHCFKHFMNHSPI